MKISGIMGIINCTPDSFYAQSQSHDLEKAIHIALQMEKEGAAFVDVGGESTRPGAPLVSEEEELERVLPLIVALKKVLRIPLSIDTRKAKVAHEAVLRGAVMINDVSGLSYDSSMASLVGKLGVKVIIMHARGNPATMDSLAEYDDVVSEVVRELLQKVEIAQKAGIAKEQIILDPGFGFAKKSEHNWEILSHLDELCKLGFPLLVGLSRKRFLGGATPEERLIPSLLAAFVAFQKGARLIRTHDVAPSIALLDFSRHFV